jgi:hypothetical protein
MTLKQVHLEPTSPLSLPDFMDVPLHSPFPRLVS